MISILIVTYNSLNLINDCIKSICDHHQSILQNIEIIVVDNSSEVEGRKMQDFLKSKYPSVKFVKSENTGYGAGNNRGIELAKNDIIAIMNPDVILTKSIFQNIFYKFKANPKLALVGGKQFGGRNISFYWKPEKEPKFLAIPLLLFCNNFNIFNDKFFYLSGAFLLIDKNKFQKIGLFDEKIFLYCEEPDISTRFRNEGLTIEFDKNIEYKHLIESRDISSDFSFNEEIKSMKYYFNKFKYDYNYYLRKKVITFKTYYLIAKMLGLKFYKSSFEISYKRYRLIYENRNFEN